MKNSRKSNRRPRNRIAIFYKSHGEFIGPYGNLTFSKSKIAQSKKDGTLRKLQNYILRSPLQLRRRVA